MNVRAHLLPPALAALSLLAACASTQGSGSTAGPSAPNAHPVADAPETDAGAGIESQTKALDKKKFELECARLEARIERLSTEASARDVKSDVEDAEFDRALSQKEFENFKAVQLPAALADGQLDIDRAQQRLKEQTQELDELKALYKSEDFADLTKEFVVQRHQSMVDFAARGLELAQKEFTNKRDFDLVQKEAGLAHKLERAERDYREAKAKQERNKQETELKNKKTEHELDELEAEVKKLEEALKEAKAKQKMPAEKKASDKASDAPMKEAPKPETKK
ncbi:MAG: hypothetical protein IPJ19_14980 [Planctomycetes bacterium]|nr:hypothetical protein [Planctomycetota bacterium]